MSFIDDNGIDFPNLTTVCVDNEAVRKRIGADKKFEIRLVPTFLKVVGATGVASKFEGDRAFQLVAYLAPPPSAAVATAPPRATSGPQVSFTRLPDPSPSAELAVSSGVSHPPNTLSALQSEVQVPQRQSAAQARQERHAIDREFEERKRGGGADKTPIDQILDLETIMEREEETDHQNEEQVQIHRGKVNAAQIMDQRNSEFAKSNAGPTVPVPDYTQKKTGSKISVADIMAHQS